MGEPAAPGGISRPSARRAGQTDRRRSPVGTSPGDGPLGPAPLRWALVVTAVVLVAVAPLDPSAYVMRMVQSAAVLGIAVAAARRHRGGAHRGWGLVALGALTWLVALATGWTSVLVDSELLHIGARWVFCGGAVVALVGLAHLLSDGTRRRDAIQALDAVVVASSAIVVLGTLLDEHIDLASLASGMQVPLAGAVVTLALAAFTTTASINQPRHRLAAWLSVGFWLSLCGDLVQLTELSAGASLTANSYTPVLAAGTLMLLFAAVHGERPPEDVAALPRAEAHPATAARRRALAAFVLAALVVVSIDVLTGGDQRALVLVAVAVMVIGQTTALLLALSDLRDEESAGRHALAELRTSQERLALALDAAPVGLGIAQADGTFVLANRALGELIGEEPSRIVGRRWSDFLAASEKLPARILPGGRRRDGVSVRRFVRPDGRPRVVEVSIRDYPAGAGEQLWLGIGQDVTERVQAIARLEHLATHDELTDLPNRRAFARLLTEHLGTGAGGVLSVCDLDQFKFVNDTLGHTAGDTLLTSIARRFEALRDLGCTVARIGGDEFCVLVPPSVRAPLALVASVFAEPFDLGDGEQLHATASVGGTTIRPGTDPERLVAEADAAMYRAKSRGAGRREMYSPTTGDRMRARRRTTSGLHRALRDDELEVWFQPIATSELGEVVALETLLRWRDPDRGLLLPGEFIDAAEQSGLIAPIGEEVLRRALAAAGSGPWRDHGAQVSVNVSALQVTDPAFVSMVERVVADSGVDPARLWLEITESALLLDERAARRTCTGLRELGAHLSLDDFGTGYGSLSYLMKFPVDAIKIDRGFVGGLDAPGAEHLENRQTPGLAIVAAMVDLTTRLGLSCVAEGVETPAQLRRLRSLGCPFVQGHLVGAAAAEPVFSVLPELSATLAAEGLLSPPAGVS